MSLTCFGDVHGQGPTAVLRCWRALPLVAAVVLGGCTTYTPEPLDRAAILRELHEITWEKAHETGPEGSGLTATPGDFQPDNGLNAEEIAWVAVCLHPGLKEALAAQGEAAGDLITAGLWPNPELEAAIRLHTESAAKTVEAGLSFEVLRWEERAAKREGATAAVAAAGWDLRKEVWAVACTAREAYWQTVAGQARVQLKTTEWKLAQRWAEQIRIKQDRGAATAMESQLANMRAIQIQLELNRSKQAAAGQERNLRRVMGLPPQAPVPLEVPASLAGGETLPAGWEPLMEALLSTPELEKAAADYHHAEQELRGAIARQYPGLRIGPSAEFEYDGSWSSFLGLGFSVDLPIFDRNRGEIARLTAARAGARAAYRRRLHSLCADLADAWSQAQSARLELQLFETEIMPQAAALQALAEKSFLAGQQDVLELLAAQAAMIALQDQQLEAQIADRLATLQLERVLGRPFAPVPAGSAEITLPPAAPAPAAADAPKMDLDDKEPLP